MKIFESYSAVLDYLTKSANYTANDLAILYDYKMAKINGEIIIIDELGILDD